MGGVKPECDGLFGKRAATLAALIDRGRGDQTGASAVEFALVMPVLVAFVAGIVDFGMVFSNQAALHQGVGAAARQGVIAKPGTSSACSITGLSSATSVETKSLICLTKDRIGLDGARVKLSFPAVKTKGGALLLCAQYPLESVTGFFDPLLNGVLTSKVRMRIEQDLSSFGSTEEPALPGASWGWCA